MKRCSKCGEEKPLEDFGVDKRATTGRKPRCKVCTCEDDQAYRQTDRAAALGRARMKKWRDRNPEAVKARNDAWRSDPNNRELHKAIMRNWREANPEKARAAEKRWREANLPRKAEIERQRLARKRNAFVAEVDVDLLIAEHGNECGICGDPIEEPFQVDHIVPLAAGGEHSQANAQLAHPYCNRRKGARTDYLAA